MEQHIEKMRYKGRLSEKELVHLSGCRHCQEAFADYVEQYEVLPAPRHLKASVLERSRRPDIQIIAGSNQISKKLQMFYFSLKVGAAVLCALSLLTIAPVISRQLETDKDFLSKEYNIDDSDRQWLYYERVNNLTAKLNKLSNTNMEVRKHDKKEK